MHRDAVRSRFQADACDARHARDADRSSVAKACNLVDVDAETSHVQKLNARGEPFPDRPSRYLSCTQCQRNVGTERLFAEAGVAPLSTGRVSMSMSPSRRIRSAVPPSATLYFRPV